MGLYDKVINKIPGLLDLPDQTLPGVPIVEIYGDQRVLIEGRCGLLEYSGDFIRFHNGVGVVSVQGCGMKMAELSKNKMIITGKIESISFIGG